MFTIEPRFTLSNNRTIETTGGLRNATGCSVKQNKNRKHNKTKNHKRLVKFLSRSSRVKAFPRSNLNGHPLVFNKPIRIALTKIRLSSHLFHVERGRWNARKVEIKDRICSLCRVVEDEFHCMIECPRYESARVGNLPTSLKRKPSMYKFINVLKCKEPEMYKTIGVLCMKVMREHRKFI